MNQQNLEVSDQCRGMQSTHHTHAAPAASVARIARRRRHTCDRTYLIFYSSLPFTTLLQRQAEREERERRKAEALAAKEREKRYPMEDLQLLQELTVEAAQSGRLFRAF